MATYHEEGFSTDSLLPSGFLHGFNVVSTEPHIKQSLPFLEENDNIDILVELLGDDVDFDDDYVNIFVTSASTSASECTTPVKPTVNPQLCISAPVTPLPVLASLQPPATEKPSVFKSVSSNLSISKQSLYREGAINRWLLKRERRVFVKKVTSSVKSSAAQSGKVVPNRSNANGRFVKSTRGFVSITQVQNACTSEDDEDYARHVFGDK